MDESNCNSSRESLLQVQDQASSRTKRKLRLLICLVTLFTIIITAIISALVMLKHKTESKSLSSNPINAIRAVCWVVSEDEDSCFDSITMAATKLTITQTPILSRPNTDKINPSQIFILSLYASRNDLLNISSSKSTDPKTTGVLKDCQGMFNFAVRLLNESITSLGVDPDGKILKINNKVVWDLQMWIGEAIGQVQRCVDLVEEIQSPAAVEIRERSYVVRRKLRISRGILKEVNKIMDMFYPRIGTAFGSVLEIEYGFSVWLYCSGYLLLVFLFCVLLRLY